MPNNKLSGASKSSCASLVLLPKRELWVVLLKKNGSQTVCAARDVNKLDEELNLYWNTQELVFSVELFLAFQT